MNNYKCYIFDWDGTLMDSIERIVSSMQAAAKSLNISIPNDEITKSIIGLSLPIAVNTLFPDKGVNTQEKIVEQYKLQFQTLNTTPMPLFNNVIEMLNQLKQNEKIIAVATGKGRNGLERVMELTQTKHYFNATRCADETKSKPHPEMLNQLLNELSINANEAVMIGDTGFDLEMANNAGIDCIAVTMGVGSAVQLAQYHPKAVVNSINELIALII